MESRRRTDGGFTIVELLIAAGIIGILGLAFMNVFAYTRIMTNRSSEEAMTEIGRTVGERMMRIHFQRMAPSLNVMNGPDALDANGRNFFDFNDEYPVELRPAAERSREIFLSPSGRREAYFIVSGYGGSPKISFPPAANDDPSSGSAIVIDPARFYDVTDAGQDVSGSLTYVGPLNDQYLADIAPRLWKPRTILFFYAVGGAKPPGAAASGFVRPLVFFTRVNDESPPLGMVNEDFGGRFTAVHPFTGATIPDIDSFFRQLPSAGGGAPYVYVRPVEFVHYRIENDSTKPGHFVLTTARWRNGAFTAAQVLATEVTEVRIIRPSVAEALVNFSIVTEGNE